MTPAELQALNYDALLCAVRRYLPENFWPGVLNLMEKGFQSERNSAAQSDTNAPIPRHRLPVVVDLPGMSGTEWDDVTVLLYLCDVITMLGCDLRARVAPKIKSDWRRAQFFEALFVANIRMQEFELGGGERADMVPVLGLAGVKKASTDVVLAWLTFALYENRELIQKEVLSRYPGQEGMALAEALVLVEALTSREGMPTELDERERTGQPTALQAIAWKMKADVIERLTENVFESNKRTIQI